MRIGANMESKPENALSGKRISIGDGKESPFLTRNGIFQDGTTPVCRDKDGTLWAISGHTHAGHIVRFSGTTIRNLKERYEIKTNFEVGAAGKAFDGIAYPDGVRSRGSVWPFGLVICPVTHRFFAFFHNETGWAGQGTAYDARGGCETPYIDSDFRHIGLMHSDDEGQTWDFDRWILAGENVGFTERFNPESDVSIGQKFGIVDLGSGDFSVYADDEFIYIFYNKMSADMIAGTTAGIDVYVARSRRRTDGIMGDFVKFYDGAFCEAGIMGKETPIVRNLWHAKVIRLESIGAFVMSGSPFNRLQEFTPGNITGIIGHVVQLRTSTDLVHWSDPIELYRDGEKFGDHYCALYPAGEKGDFVAPDNKLILQLNGNATDVMQYEIEIEE